MKCQQQKLCVFSSLCFFFATFIMSVSQRIKFWGFMFQTNRHAPPKDGGSLLTTWGSFDVQPKSRLHLFRNKPPSECGHFDQGLTGQILVKLPTIYFRRLWIRWPVLKMTVTRTQIWVGGGGGLYVYCCSPWSSLCRCPNQRWQK